jgi:hypothetical protein
LRYVTYKKPFKAVDFFFIIKTASLHGRNSSEMLQVLPLKEMVKGLPLKEMKTFRLVIYRTRPTFYKSGKPLTGRGFSPKITGEKSAAETGLVELLYTLIRLPVLSIGRRRAGGPQCQRGYGGSRFGCD